MHYLIRLLFLLLLSMSFNVFSGPLPSPISSADFEFNGEPPAEQVDLGQKLFFDKILSAQDDVSCATCHHPLSGTSDGVSLGLGVGARGVSVMRTSKGLPVSESAPNRIVRNSPALFNLGWRGWTTLMTDGDISIDESQPSGFATPLGEDFPLGLENLLAAQNMMPAAQPREMAGTLLSHPISSAAIAGDLEAVWDLLAEKVSQIDEYADQFIAVYPDISAPEDITFVHIANALAAFQISAFQAFNSRFDEHLRGNFGALSGRERRGMELFYGKAGCDSCHSGPMLTDQNFYAISIPQIGPGRQFGVGGKDTGRFRVTREKEDMFRYKTPSLRNVALTGPWGHDGAYGTLEAVVRHHLDPVASLEAYDPSQAVLPDSERWGDEDFTEHDNLTAREFRASKNELDPVVLSAMEFNDLIAFLHTLTDPASLDLRSTIPMEVPSQLPISD